MEVIAPTSWSNGVLNILANQTKILGRENAELYSELINSINKIDIDEERNNAFLAVTRAKRWLYVTYPKQRMMPWKDLNFQQKSRFVREIE